MSSASAAGRIAEIDHIRFWVGNAKQAAHWYCVCYGFKPFAYRGLETGSRVVVSHAIRQNNVTFVFESALMPDDAAIQCVLAEMGAHQTQHGDGVKDIALRVENLEAVLEHAKMNGAKIVRDIWEESDDSGTVRMATIRTYGDVVHTFVERQNYTGLFLPGYAPHPYPGGVYDTLASPDLQKIDHVVSNHPNMTMEHTAKWYENVLSFHRFWSIDEKQVRTANNTSLRSQVVTNEAETVKLAIIEPAPLRNGAKSQTQEYVDYYGGSGVQHIAFISNDMVKSIRALKARGCQFHDIPDAYYENLRERLKSAKITVTEDLDELQKLHILVDFDEHGYILQVLSKPVEDRPTMFLEVIQRHNHNGFGAGNYNALFAAVEADQRKRGNLFVETVDGITNGDHKMPF